MVTQADVMRVFLQNRSMLLAFIRMRVVDFHLAEDIFQETAPAIGEDCVGRDAHRR